MADQKAPQTLQDPWLTHYPNAEKGSHDEVSFGQIHGWRENEPVWSVDRWRLWSAR